ncbi:hypothetical protein [Cryobacterium sp. TMT4-31]|uniref:hypothetical protein n=1 Tax=Cryobacterium sp. TMT4-31 TaxID=1259259 RepID=UPI00106D9B05|nr:hypothetical protein [Cryobacterium sp. TMT4-31]TFC89887.1 hypothetical protein E3T19_07280 [Cryobacterium sp. TMT4-31]
MITLLILAAVAAVLVVVFFATYSRGLEVLSFSIGASSGFILLQVNGVHIYTILVLVYVVVSRAKNPKLLARILLFVTACGLMVVTAFVGDLTTTVGLGFQLALLAVSTGLFVFRADPKHLQIARNGLLLFVTFGAATAIGQAVGILPEQLFQLEGAELHRPSGIYPEPDWLGLYSAAGVLLAVMAPLRRQWQILFLTINALGVVLASARAAVLALVVVAVWALFRNFVQHRKAAKSHGLPAIVITFVVLIGFIFVFSLFPVEVELLLHRMSSALVVGGGDGVTVARYAQIDGLRNLFESAPWYGHGLSASGRVNGFGAIDYSFAQGSTGSNWFFSLLAEGKFIAIPMIGCLIFTAAFGNRKGAYLLVLILVNSVFSNALFFPLTWFAIAMCMVPDAVEAGGEDVSDIPILQETPHKLIV